MKRIWTIISAVAGVLAVIVTLYIFWQSRIDSRMRLRIELLGQSSLVNPNVSKTGKDIQITYNGRKIDNFVIYLFHMSNPGGRPIRSNDFEEAIALTFSGADEIVSALQTGAEPRSVKISPQVQDSRVIVPPTLFNPGDSCTIEISVIPSPNQATRIDIGGRIAGIKDLEFSTTPPPDHFFAQNKTTDALFRLQTWLILIFLSFYILRQLLRLIRIRVEIGHRDGF
jgi:hypothetical protein